MLAGFLPRLASLVSQPAVLAAGVATGVAVGAVGVGTGAIPVTDPGPRLVALFECPDSGRVVKSLPSNQSVLVTARSADGAWLEIYIGEPGAERGWARATSLQLKAAPDSLPVADCTPEATLPPPTGLASPVTPTSASLPPSSAVPSAASTVVPFTAPPATPSPTPGPTKTPKPTKTPTPTAVPLTGPVISHLSIYDGQHDGDGVWRVYYGCSDASSYFGWTVDAADSDGPVSVRQYWEYTNAPESLSQSMTMEDSYGELWDGGFTVQSDWPAGPIHVWFQGRDALDNLGPIFDPASEGYTFEVGVCKP